MSEQSSRFGIDVETGSTTSPKLPPRPRIVLPPQSPQVYNMNPLYVNPSLNASMNPPMTPGTAGSAPNPYITYPFPFLNSNKASDFMFKQFSGFRDFTMNTAKSGLSVGEKTAFWIYNKVSTWSRKWFTHVFLFFVVFAYSVAGAMLFVAVEGANEELQLVDIRREKYVLLDRVRNISRMETRNVDAWNGAVSQALADYEAQLYKSFHQAGVKNRDRKVWTFWNAVFYCGTIYTTIGYGHISPSTTTGRAITIIYAVFGIPMFLILLADFGKLLTRVIKFLWAFVRRLYYTGSCRRMRKTETAQEVMKGVQMMYEIATFRRPSHSNIEECVVPIPPKASLGDLTITPQKSTSEASVPLRTPVHLSVDKVSTIGNETPNTPAPSNFAVDDEFNLPISVAILVLLLYIMSGALLYWFWENWSLFESFYFVFISMSTIGFGDFVPEHPMFMMCSIIYLIFGLALTSMCINVVQVKLSDSFRQASAKIGATIGLKIAEDDGSITHNPPTVEIADVHTTIQKPKDKGDK